MKEKEKHSDSNSISYSMTACVHTFLSAPMVLLLYKGPWHKHT